MILQMDWTAVVVTCQTRDTVKAVQHELHQKQKLGLFPGSTIVLAIEDPQRGVGSGGATLNALLVVAEHISARRNHSVVNPDVLLESRILIFNLGRQYGYDPCGRAFLPLPVNIPTSSGCDFVPTNLDILYHLMTTKIAVGGTPGVWVCSTDMLLDLPETIAPCDVTGVDVCVLSVPGSIQYAMRHGVYKVSKEGYISDIIYRGSQDQIQACCTDGKTVPLVAGVVYFSPHVAETLLGFHTSPPLDACTYVGVDSGAKPLQLALFFDLLLAMCSDVSDEDFTLGRRSASYGAKPDTSHVSMSSARRMIWKALRPFKAKIFWIAGGRHLYLEDEDRSLLEILAEFGSGSQPAARRISHGHSFPEDISTAVSIQNSIISESCELGSGCSVYNSCLDGDVKIGENCYISGLDTSAVQSHTDNIDIHIRPSTVCIGVNVKSGTSASERCHKVFITWGVTDKLEVAIRLPGSTFCNKPWSSLFERLSLEPWEIWTNDIPEEGRTLLNARLFTLCESLADVTWLCAGSSTDQQSLQRWRHCPKLSLKEILAAADHAAEFSSRRSLFHEISKQKIRTTLLEVKGQGLLGLYRAAVNDGRALDFLTILDDVACECGSPGIAARTLANIADVLGAMARGNGGLRSGPAGNVQWAHAFQLLEKEDISGGVRALAAERTHWLSQPELLVRAARHYEGAGQILIRHAVMTARQYIRTSPCERPAVDEWVVAESPARIDIAGGWSDTPPITYEHGGAVINAAITLDGKRPIGAKVCRIEKTELVLHIGTSADVSSSIKLTKLEQLSDYNNPQAQGALLKAAFICAEVVEFPSAVSLCDQLSDKYQGGFELYSWSDLPHGSGLGASSILAGAIMAALWKVSGKQYDIDALNHAVAHLEQMLTTGGGWQDQVGGLTGGIKVGHSAATLPMQIEMSFPVISAETLRDFSDRLVLVYTGKTRLARNLLQNVLRNWYARDPGIVETEDDLVRTAWDCAKAFENGDLVEVGACMSHYWELKKRMAPGCEPVAVSHMMSALRPHALGLSMAGAGGGGFLYVLTKQPHATASVQQVLDGMKGIGNVTVHDSSVDPDGLRVTVQGQGHT